MNWTLVKGWASILVVVAVAIWFMTGIITDMSHGVLEIGRRGIHKIRLEDAPILFWSLGITFLTFWAAVLAAIAYMLWDWPRQDRKLDALLARKHEIDRSVRRRLRRVPKA